jgi:hypothetical protein
MKRLYGRYLFFPVCLLSLGFFASPSLAQNFAMEFFANPADSVIIVNPDDSLSAFGKTFTMEAWVFPTGPQNGDGIIVNKENSYEMAIRAGDQLMYAINAGAWDWWGGGKPEIGKWHHVAVTYDGKETISWLNGKNTDVKKIDTLDIVKNAEPFQIGRRVCCGGTPFKGFIDEVRISDVVRYTKDFPIPKSEFVPDKNTRALYHFNEGKGDTISDATGNKKNTAKVEGKPKWSGPDKGAPLEGAAVESSGKLTTMWSKMKR